MTTTDSPLAGLKILDFSQVEFGPCATQILADFGADVVKVERPVSGDLSRGTDPFTRTDGGESAYFMSLNRNKRSIVLDLRDSAGIDVALRLARRSDVLVHNFRPGVAERLGLDYESLKPDNPRLIYAAGSGFGESGPLAAKAGQDLLAQSLSGAVARNPDSSGFPQLYPTACGDFAAGMILAQGVLLALYDRVQTGRGQRVHVSLFDTMLAMQMQELTQWMLREEPVNWVQQNLVGTFETSDGVITVVGVFRSSPLDDICRALEMEDLTARPEFATTADAIANKEALWKLLASQFKELPSAEALRRLDAEDVLCAPVLGEEDVLAHPQVAINGIIESFEHPIHGSVRVIGHPLRMSEGRKVPTRAAPLLGEHTDEVLTEAGLSFQEISDLRNGGGCG